MTAARTRRTVITIVSVWVVGLLLVLGLWQRVDAACTDGATASLDCGSARAAEPAGLDG